MGRSAVIDPAADSGRLAGTQIDEFAFDLLRRLDAGGNLCVSPTSIALALAMVRGGARGQTATEMDNVLHGFGNPAEAPEIAALLAAFSNQTFYDDPDPAADPSATPDPAQAPTAELDVSQQVFAQKGMTLAQAYLDALSSSFGAGVGVLDFAKDPEAARQTINRWGSQRTQGRIPAVLQRGDITAVTRIALANAIYLKAAWAEPFDRDATSNLPFTRADGSKVSVPTMAAQELLQFSAGTGYRAINLPYTPGTTLSMTVIVPDNMASFVQGLNAARLDAIDAAAGYQTVALTLPRFSIDSRYEMADLLAAMGMPTAFTGAADFSGITEDTSLSIEKVVHQANIDVVEEGTTAAAVTVVGGKGGIGPGATPRVVIFHVDHPFLYLIREQTTGAVLFMGRVDDPAAAP